MRATWSPFHSLLFTCPFYLSYHTVLCVCSNYLHCCHFPIGCHFILVVPLASIFSLSRWVLNSPRCYVHYLWWSSSCHPRSRLLLHLSNHCSSVWLLCCVCIYNVPTGIVVFVVLVSVGFVSDAATFVVFNFVGGIVTVAVVVPVTTVLVGVIGLIGRSSLVVIVFYMMMLWEHFCVYCIVFICSVSAGLTLTGIMINRVYCYVRSKSDRISVEAHAGVVELTFRRLNRRPHLIQ